VFRGDQKARLDHQITGIAGSWRGLSVVTECGFCTVMCGRLLCEFFLQYSYHAAEGVIIFLFAA